MHVYENPVAATHERFPWNKGKLTGAKPPFRPKHVWSIRTKLRLEGRIRDLVNVQPGNRQQAPRLRCRCTKGRRHPA
jgi:hypothetical protein